MRSGSLRFAKGAIFSPWFTVLSLTLESSEVIGLRVAKLAGGGIDAEREAQLILSEKVSAVFERSARLIRRVHLGQALCRRPRALASRRI